MSLDSLKRKATLRLLLASSSKSRICSIISRDGWFFSSASFITCSWSWLHKMRRAMVRHGRSPLSGIVEVDETLIGGEEHVGKRGRGAGRKSVVVIAIEVNEPKGFGRVRMRRITDASGECLIPFICDSVAPGSMIRTDSWRGYNDLRKFDYTHKKVNLSDSDDPAQVVIRRP